MNAFRGDVDGARADIDRAIALNPSDDLPMGCGARSAKCRGAIPEAIADYDRSLVLLPDQPLVLRQRGKSMRSSWSVPGHELHRIGHDLAHSHHWNRKTDSCGLSTTGPIIVTLQFDYPNLLTPVDRDGRSPACGPAAGIQAAAIRGRALDEIPAGADYRIAMGGR